MLANLIFPSGDEVVVTVKEGNTIGDLISHLSKVYSWEEQFIHICYNSKRLESSDIICHLTSLNMVDLDIFYEKSFFTFQRNEREMAVSTVEQFEILQKIREEKVLQNIDYTFTHCPEVFVPVESLRYVTIQINNVQVEALLDTGASLSVIPLNLVKLCNLELLIDHEYTSKVECGSGYSLTMGVIYSCPYELCGIEGHIQLAVLNRQGDSMILGLNWMKLNKVCMNLGDDTITFHGKTIKTHEISE
ncbi:Clan AA, family A2, retrotansposon aspartic peptidase [Tritrichomonas foetus]|uniref:Clan AA, family A2, retrotansposon aspartic peptidase n=1 Tax=Tritrichomonas foetus TaxID=1144522 RepID=A0A1J4KPT7_9EUKA|nr:Clan AA, family A2, retrotansposon aspartic peptidase [Tritrichomonas foetus]|eukprot:OHT11718.1 Clan AA, family A2, retrotansposon aspartic peptidase [Tritrichomonas foetus]